MSRKAFHERPLVGFTTLATLGAGLLTAPLIGTASGGRAAGGWVVPGAGLALLAAGLVVSLLHLGRPWLSPLALAGMGRSRLSAEVALAAATLAAGAVAVLFGGSQAAAILAALLALAFLVALGSVYALPAQRTWRGTAMLAPPLMGLVAGGLALEAVTSPATGRTAQAAGLLIAADALVFLYRWLQVGRVGRLPHSVTLLGARVALADLVPGVLVLLGLPGAALGALLLGILSDRLAFYLLAAQHTTEAEIARVEALING